MIYAGIDEAGYGPMVGPMVVARSAFEVSDFSVEQALDNAWQLSSNGCLWQRLKAGVCRTMAEHRKSHRLAVNDSKKLNSKASGLLHLEAGSLSFMSLSGSRGRSVANLGDWLVAIGSERDDLSKALWWYADEGEHGQPWESLPHHPSLSTQQISLNTNMLKACCDQGGVTLVEPMDAAVVWADRFNHMARATRSKAAVSFFYVARHLTQLATAFADRDLLVVVDRQGGRTRYREQLSESFPDWEMAVFAESRDRSVYQLKSSKRRITIMFAVEAEQDHLPVALASMTAKYTRELLMHRFNTWFCRRLPELKPTKGYGVDGKRFVRDIEPGLQALGIDPNLVIRCV